MKQAAFVKKQALSVKKIFQKRSGFEAYVVSKNCALEVDILIYDKYELDRILESLNIEEYDLIDLPMEQHDDSSQEHTGVRMAPTLDTSRILGLAPHREGCLSPIERLLVLGYKNSSPEMVSTRARGPFCACASENQFITNIIKKIKQVTCGCQYLYNCWVS